MNSRKKLIVVGGGAAGFFCALTAARVHKDLDVVILEKSSKLLSKVKVSGGGRCNVTHACFDINEMSGRYPRGKNFVKKIFHEFFTTDTIEWFRSRGVELKTEADGRMFPVTDSSQTIIDCLLREATKQGVEVRMNVTVSGIVHDGDGEQHRFEVQTTGGIVGADYLCIATGGFPKAAMFEWLTACGHTIAAPVPSLFTFNLPGNKITSLMGVVVEDARVKLSGSKLEQTGPVLITHWGLSGPAILKLSAWGAVELAERNYEFGVMVNWLPEYTEQSMAEKFKSIRIEQAGRSIRSKNPFGLPQRFWEYLLQEIVGEKEIRWSDLPAKDQNRLIRSLCSYELQCKGKTTFKEEFVTAGGIRTEEINASTMMSRQVPGLYFAGEVINVDGITGGYNFQNAWTTGYIAGHLRS